MSETLTIPHLVTEAAQRWPNREAVIDGARRVDFKQLAESMVQAASAFVASGLKPGEAVGLWADNSLDWIVACLGIQAAGGVLVPINTRFKGEEAEYILNRSRAAMIVMAADFLGNRYPEMLEPYELPLLRHRIAIGGSGDSSWDNFVAGGHEDARNEVESRLRALDADDLSDIMFTSGTTGAPKGALATHGQTVRTARLWNRATTLGEDDRFLILWPFFHCSGYKAGWVSCLAAGATILPEAVLDVDRLLGTVERERVTFLPGPPTLFQTLLTSPQIRPEKLGSLRVSVTGASAVAPSMIEAMRKDLGIPVVLTGYGLTETCGTVTMSAADDPPEIVTSTCGRAIEGIEVAVIDDNGDPLAPGEAGEIMVRGMNVMQGYLDDPEATAAAINADGWLHTGDIGTLDEAGYLRITDRKKDVFIVGGFNCYPAEIERILMAHPAILNVAVTGVPDERMGEVGRAFVVLKPGQSMTQDELIAWSRERMANFKVPRYVEIVDALPTNATGKVQKFRLPA